MPRWGAPGLNRASVLIPHGGSHTTKEHLMFFTQLLWRSVSGSDDLSDHPIPKQLYALPHILSMDFLLFKRLSPVRIPLWDRHGGPAKPQAPHLGNFINPVFRIKLASYGGLIKSNAGILKPYMCAILFRPHFCWGTSSIFLLQLKIHYFPHYRYHTLSILAPAIFPPLKRPPRTCGLIPE